MKVAPGRRIIGSRAMADELSTLFERISDMIDARPGDPGRLLLNDMEHTLTDGYARALELESEVMRIERRIGELAHEVEAPDEAEELRGLASRMRVTQENLARLRDLLADLRQRVDALRSAPQAAR
jgi:hypothetical protein